MEDNLRLGAYTRSGSLKDDFARVRAQLRRNGFPSTQSADFAFGDVRVCIDWDSGRTYRDMKDLKGHWYKVADQ